MAVVCAGWEPVVPECMRPPGAVALLLCFHIFRCDRLQQLRAVLFLPGKARVVHD